MIDCVSERLGVGGGGGEGECETDCLTRVWSLFVVCQEKVRRSPNGFVRDGNEREREGEGGGGVSRETSSKTNWLEGPH